MRYIFKELASFTLKQHLTVWYFTLSFCSLCVSNGTPLWIVGLLVLNFANAARLVRKLPLLEIEEHHGNTHQSRNTDN